MRKLRKCFSVLSDPTKWGWSSEEKPLYKTDKWNTWIVLGMETAGGGFFKVRVKPIGGLTRGVVETEVHLPSGIGVFQK